MSPATEQEEAEQGGVMLTDAIAQGHVSAVQPGYDIERSGPGREPRHELHT